MAAAVDVGTPVDAAVAVEQTASVGTWTPWVLQKSMANSRDCWMSPSSQASVRQQVMLPMKLGFAQMHAASRASQPAISDPVV